MKNLFYQVVLHVGNKRVFDIVKTRLHWPNYEKAIRDFVIKVKDQIRKRVPLVSIVIQEPFEHRWIDYTPK